MPNPPQPPPSINFRVANPADVPAIHALMRPYVAQHLLLSRTEGELAELTRHGFVAEVSHRAAHPPGAELCIDDQARLSAKAGHGAPHPPGAEPCVDDQARLSAKAGHGDQQLPGAEPCIDDQARLSAKVGHGGQQLPGAKFCSDDQARLSAKAGHGGTQLPGAGSASATDPQPGLAPPMQLLGFAAIEVYSPKLAELQCLAVHHEHRNTGIGKRLVADCLDRARSLNVMEVLAISSSEDFLRSCGFDYSLPDQKKALFAQLRPRNFEDR